MDAPSSVESGRRVIESHELASPLHGQYAPALARYAIVRERRRSPRRQCVVFSLTRIEQASKNGHR
jgi:hypothetical protein